MPSKPTRLEFALRLAVDWPQTQSHEADRGLTIRAADTSTLIAIAHVAEACGLSPAVSRVAEGELRVFGFPRKARP